MPTRGAPRKIKSRLGFIESGPIGAGTDVDDGAHQMTLNINLPEIGSKKGTSNLMARLLTVRYSWFRGNVSNEDDSVWPTFKRYAAWFDGGPDVGDIAGIAPWDTIWRSGEAQGKIGFHMKGKTSNLRYFAGGPGSGNTFASNDNSNFPNAGFPGGNPPYTEVGSIQPMGSETFETVEVDLQGVAWTSNLLAAQFIWQDDVWFGGLYTGEASPGPGVNGYYVPANFEYRMYFACEVFYELEYLPSMEFIEVYQENQKYNKNFNLAGLGGFKQPLLKP